ncbi:MAG: cytochrome c [Gammaproteobacteria bacterium]|nr:cytochrome c [Gammaproteobacteria bacterium]
MKKFNGVVLSVFLLVAASYAHAGDAAAGKIKSSACASCHGLNGVSTMGMNPNLAGQKKEYLIKSIKDYRDGKRNDATMGAMVKGLSDADIENLATFYSELK